MYHQHPRHPPSWLKMPAVHRPPSTPTAKLVSPASAECRTSDLTLAESGCLRGKMDGFDPRGRSVAGIHGRYRRLPHRFYSGRSSGTLMSHEEHRVVRAAGVR